MIGKKRQRLEFLGESLQKFFQGFHRLIVTEETWEGQDEQKKGGKKDVEKSLGTECYAS